MGKTDASTFVTAASVAALLTVAAQAQAQANRTFVSGHGDDTNPCSIAAPCRSFAGAITKTNAGGEIAVLDTAGYGPVTINKSVSIVNEEGVEAGVTVTSGIGITITTGASDVVNLRGMTLVGGNSVSTGILFNAAGTLNIQNCVIRGFGANDVSFFPNGSATFNITDTIVTLSGPAPPEPSMLKPSRAASIAWTGLNVPVTVPENLGSTETASKPILETIARHLAGG